ncbi:MAG: hypothetical protein ACQER7_03700 [Bacteroidota bacterium]
MIKVGGVTQDITADTVDLTVYIPQSGTVFTKEGDVSAGDGIVTFDFTTEDTNIKPGSYSYEIRWTLSNGESHVIRSSSFKMIKSYTT